MNKIKVAKDVTNMMAVIDAEEHPSKYADEIADQFKRKGCLTFMDDDAEVVYAVNVQ